MIFDWNGSIKAAVVLIFCIPSYFIVYFSTAGILRQISNAKTANISGDYNSFILNQLRGRNLSGHSLPSATSIMTAQILHRAWEMDALGV